MSDPTIQNDAMEFPQVDADRMFDELGELHVDLDDDPLVFGPKRLNAKTAQVRRMLDRCEKLFLSVSRKLQGVRRGLRVAETDFDLAKKDLFANDPETRAGRSVSDREAIAAGKLEKEIRGIHELNLAAEDLDAVLVVIKAKRADLKDTEGRLRDQIRLCSEEIGLGGRWGSKVPNAPEINGRPAIKTATGADVDDIANLIEGLEGEIQLARDAGTWEDPLDMSLPPVQSDPFIMEPIDPGYDASKFQVPVEDTPPLTGTFCAECGSPQFMTRGGICCVYGHGGADSVSSPDQVARPESVPEKVEVPTAITPVEEPEVAPTVEDIHLDTTPSAAKDLETSMAATVEHNDVDIFLEEVTVSAYQMPKPDMRKVIDDIDVDSILDMFEAP